MYSIDYLTILKFSFKYLPIHIYRHTNTEIPTHIHSYLIVLNLTELNLKLLGLLSQIFLKRLIVINSTQFDNGLSDLIIIILTLNLKMGHCKQKV